MCLNEQPYWPGGRSYLQQFSVLNRICHVRIRTRGQTWCVLNASVGHVCCEACIEWMSAWVGWPVFSSVSLHCAQRTGVTWFPHETGHHSHPPAVWTQPLPPSPWTYRCTVIRAIIDQDICIPSMSHKRWRNADTGITRILLLIFEAPVYKVLYKPQILIWILQSLHKCRVGVFPSAALIFTTGEVTQTFL